MDAYIELAGEGFGRIANGSAAVLILAAALPALFYLRSNRPLGLCALAIAAGAVTLTLFGIGGLAGAVVVTIANILLVSAAASSTRKRLALAEDRLEIALSAIRDLEIAEERRQTFSARHPQAARSK